LFLPDLVDGVIAHLFQSDDAVPHTCERLPYNLASKQKQVGVLSRSAIRPAQRGHEGLVIPFHDSKRFVRDRTGDLSWRSPENAVSDFDTMIEKRKGLPWLKSLQPKRHFAKLNGRRIDIHPVNTTPDDLAQRGLDFHRRRFDFSCAYKSKAFGNAPGCRDEEMTASARGITNFQSE
jgi:hypothetical protein